MQFKLLVVNNRDQSKWAMVHSLWLVTNAEKARHSKFTIANWIDYHY